MVGVEIPTDAYRPREHVMAIESKTAEQTILQRNGVFIFHKDFTNESCAEAITWIIESNLTPEPAFDRLTLVINSPGGDLDSCWALIDTMQGSTLPVDTIGTGCVASCGILTLMAGNHRIATPNTNLLSHQFSTGAYDKQHELMSSVGLWKTINDQMIAHYKNCTGLSLKTIKEKLLPPSDVWLTPKEAKKFHIIDEIKLVSF
jgi:ATP-dependent Clp protease, protease subunit